ncbi:hypothetical protein FDW94_11195 [Citrobacter sp. wls757]|nr:hypothetical protein D3H39_06045 [Citrobacter portucalensis]TKU45477.1 hypothetical protein FDW94_11195 [Citrobacter sp. wls757]
MNNNYASILWATIAHINYSDKECYFNAHYYALLLALRSLFLFLLQIQNQLKPLSSQMKP